MLDLTLADGTGFDVLSFINGGKVVPLQIVAGFGHVAAADETDGAGQSLPKDQAIQDGS